MQAPTWFLKELDEFDSDLRLRWSRRLELWQLERRVRRALHPGTIKSSDWDDDVIRARDGYLLVSSITPHSLSRTIFERLRASDLWANGGWERIADQMDMYDEIEEEDKWKKFSEDVRDYSKEVYSFLAHREHRSLYMGGLVP